MHRYLMLLGVAVVTISVLGGAIQLSASYGAYRSHLQAAGGVAGTPLTALDEVRWQIAQLVGGGIIAGGAIAGSMLMALAWIGRTLEQLRDRSNREAGEAKAQTVAAGISD